MSLGILKPTANQHCFVVYLEEINDDMNFFKVKSDHLVFRFVRYNRDFYKQI